MYAYFLCILGCVVRRIKKFSSCNSCNDALILNELNEDDETEELYRFIQSKDRGNLLYPNKDLVNLIIVLEQIILKHIREDGVKDLLINMKNLSSSSHTTHL